VCHTETRKQLNRHLCLLNSNSQQLEQDPYALYHTATHQPLTCRLISNFSMILLSTGTINHLSVSHRNSPVTHLSLVFTQQQLTATGPSPLCTVSHRNSPVTYLSLVFAQQQLNRNSLCHTGTHQSLTCCLYKFRMTSHFCR